MNLHLIHHRDTKNTRYMKTSDTQFQLLLDQTCALYESEREISGLFQALSLNTNEAHLKEGIIREAEENKRQCARLEGLIKILSENPINFGAPSLREKFVKQFSAILKRVVLKHTEFGYRTAVYAAIALGQQEIANLFKGCLANTTMAAAR
jgi:hypothetical protein